MSFKIEPGDTVGTVNKKALAEIAEVTDSTAQVIVWQNGKEFQLQTRIGRTDTSLRCHVGNTVTYHADIKRFGWTS